MNTSAQQKEEREFTFSDRDFHFLTKWVNERTGIVLADHKRDMVYSRVSRRLRALGLKTFADYCDLIQGEAGDQETGNLVNAITTNLTSFFREHHHFHHLHKELTQMLSKAPKTTRLRVWSAGCSSGMETYSIAMVVKAVVDEFGISDARILATDIDTNMLNTGVRGEYNISEFENIPKKYHAEVTVDKKKETIAMSQGLKELIAFKPLNLLEDWPMKGPFDVIFCRNVVIYFDKATQQKLFARYADLMKPEGWLYIGHSENLQKVCDRFALQGRTIYRKVK